MCNKPCYSKDSYEQHLQSHMHIENKTFQCKICEKVSWFRGIWSIWLIFFLFIVLWIGKLSQGSHNSARVREKGDVGREWRLQLFRVQQNVFAANFSDPTHASARPHHQRYLQVWPLWEGKFLASYKYRKFLKNEKLFSTLPPTKNSKPTRKTSTNCGNPRRWILSWPTSGATSSVPSVTRRTRIVSPAWSTSCATRRSKRASIGARFVGALAPQRSCWKSTSKLMNPSRMVTRSIRTRTCLRTTPACNWTESQAVPRRVCPPKTHRWPETEWCTLRQTIINELLLMDLCLLVCVTKRSSRNDQDHKKNFLERSLIRPNLKKLKLRY